MCNGSMKLLYYTCIVHTEYDTHYFSLLGDSMLINQSLQIIQDCQTRL